ncbi:MAG TPA: histidine phosphatase family protein [Bacillota bacterium]|nr:histidine phosphatase family protein [Bacillota bacterium]
MQFLYIRHGEPTYDPDDLTERGRRQAEKLAQYLSFQGVDRIFSSTSNRAIQTALPTAKRLNKEIGHLDFANEKHVWNHWTIHNESGQTWLFQSPKIIDLFHSREILDLGSRWYEHPQFQSLSIKQEINRISNESNRFFAALGYQYLENGKYKVVQESDEKVALFAHQGFGFAFLSLLLEIPYPVFCTRFELGHAEIIWIEFKNEGGYAFPKVLSISKSEHLR